MMGLSVVVNLCAYEVFQHELLFDGMKANIKGSGRHTGSVC